ncbi:MAG: deoxyribonuclease IV [Clostridia bacterium]|nr:deoxyribonuclease IV [Clostridia bacterium]
MLTIGCHLSASDGYLAMAKESVRIGANTFQFFTRNPRGGAAKAIDEKDIAAFHAYCKENGIHVILAHAPYTLNAASADPKVLEFCENTMRDDLLRMEYTPGNLYNFHPGSHVKQGTEKGIALISDMLNRVLTKDQTTTVLLETMAGKGSEVGSHFEEIRAIIDRVEYREKLGVCLDTCHVSDAGYDIIHNLDDVLAEFDRVIGFDRLRAIHLNDSMNPPGAHKDRHARIGEGHIGQEALFRVINHQKLRHLPFYLETPQTDNDGYAAEIAMLKNAYMEDNQSRT